ncbi:hypothetical protein ACJX0J_017282, partial [Zea mays]
LAYPCIFQTADLFDDIVGSMYTSSFKIKNMLNKNYFDIVGIIDAYLSKNS